MKFKLWQNNLNLLRKLLVLQQTVFLHCILIGKLILRHFVYSIFVLL